MQTYTDEATRSWEETVAQVAVLQLRSVTVAGEGDFTVPFDGRLIVSLRFNIDKPRSYPRSLVHHTKKPDLDNLAKAVLDGLQNARIITDDAQITDLSLSKRYSSTEHPQGVEVDITACP